MVFHMKKYTIISPKVKAEIMFEANIPGNSVSEVATKYKISPHLLYAWRTRSKSSGNKKLIISQENYKTQPIFVEALLNEPIATTQQAPLLLKKLSLEFEDFSLGIEGKMSSKTLIQLITILEVPC